jgi:hypothetical protein
MQQKMSVGSNIEETLAAQSIDAKVILRCGISSRNYELSRSETVK